MASNKITVSFKLEDFPMVIEEMEKLLQENKQLKEKINCISNLIYELLNEYDIKVWENIDYIELADYWVKMIRKTYKDNKKADIVELETIREEEFKEYLLNYKGEDK